ncbi:MAG: hypothetical protein ACKOWF_13360 [Chloroflexota bacterium]
MPSPAMSRSGFPSAALVLGVGLGLGLAAALPIAAAAEQEPMHDADHHAMHGEDGHEGHHGGAPEEPRAIVRISGSGAVAAVQLCGGEVHAGTFAGGVDPARLPLLGCADPGEDTAVIARAASGALAAATGGLAITAPAASAPSLADLALLNAALGRRDEGGWKGHKGYGHDEGGVKETGYSAPAAAAPVSALPAAGAGDAAGAALALQAAVAAAGSAGAGVAIRLRRRMAAPGAGA